MRWRSPPPRAAAPSQSGKPSLDTECALLYTSGTTGRPKGCMLSNFYFLNSARNYLDLGGLVQFRRGEERFYNPLPLFHMNHLAITATAAILTANTLVVPERFSPARWWPEVSASGATVIHYLGVVAPMLLNQPESPADQRHKVRFGIGAGIEPQLHAAFEQRFGFPMIEVWGMTETGRIFADSREPRSIDTRAFGRPLQGLEARVVDAEDRDVPAGIEGELLVRHTAVAPRHGFFSGYLKNDAATEEAWHGGWFHTGDVVRQDVSGMLTFVDRKKNIIRRSGENIAAAEVEAVLQAHECVAQVAVLAVVDELREEEVLACVVPMPGVAAGTALAEALFEHCNAKLAYFKAPGWMLFLDRLPTTGTQKVQKTQIFAPGEDPRTRPGILDLRTRKRRG
jgi:acyl-CoA synthetase (AMP-forming)/AMP-acid ligase II